MSDLDELILRLEKTGASNRATSDICEDAESAAKYLRECRALMQSLAEAGPLKRHGLWAAELLND